MPHPIRAYALCIIAGIIVALLMTRRRWTARGGDPEAILDVALWAVPFGVVGGRLYHLITDPELYFTAGKDPIKALYIWDGGLGIWGAVALGAVGAWIGCRRRGISLRTAAALGRSPLHPWPAANFSLSTSPPTPSVAAGSRHCGSITPPTSSGCASTTGTR